MQKSIKVVALYGEAGAGKDAILQGLMKTWGQYLNLNEIVSCTTRPPREGEIDHINYHFETVESFSQMVLNGDMLEATEFNGWFYGTPLFSLDPDRINVGVFNPAGLCALMEDSRLDVLPIHINASDKTRLLRQLNRENEPDVAEICRRYFADEKDFKELFCNDEIADKLYWGIDNDSGLLGDRVKLVMRLIEAFGQNRLSDFY